MCHALLQKVQAHSGYMATKACHTLDFDQYCQAPSPMSRSGPVRHQGMTEWASPSSTQVKQTILVLLDQLVKHTP